MVRKPSSGHVGKLKHRNKRFLIYNGGIVTEVEYFEYVKQRLFGERMHTLRIATGSAEDPVSIRSKGIDPKTLVEEAGKLYDRDRKDAKKHSYDAFDTVWAVTDVDDFGDKVREAVELGQRNGVTVIISNPCFDVWLVDHVKPCPLSYTETKDCERLGKELGLMDPAKGRNYKHIVLEKIEGRYLAARNNASVHMKDRGRAANRRGHPAKSKDHNYAPWTDVPQVVDALVAEAGRSTGGGGVSKAETL